MHRPSSDVMRASVGALTRLTSLPQSQKVLTYYELDLGLNHVVRKSAVGVDNGANMVLAVPGGADGPGGCLVCCENFLIYRDEANGNELKVVIPRRETLPAHRGVLIVAGTSHRMKNMFFFLLQSEVRGPPVALHEEHVLLPVPIRGKPWPSHPR